MMETALQHGKVKQHDLCGESEALASEIWRVLGIFVDALGRLT